MFILENIIQFSFIKTIVFLIYIYIYVINMVLFLSMYVILIGLYYHLLVNLT